MINGMLAYWVHTMDPFVIKFPENWCIAGIRWYGVAYLLSFILAGKLLSLFYCKKKIKLTSNLQQNFLFILFLGILLGGRLGYVFLYDPHFYFNHPAKIFCIWEGGMSSHGGFLGIFISLLIFGYKNKLSTLSLLDLTIPLGTLGIFLGRCANFINGEVFGTFTTVPWGVIFNNEILARHPSQLYEAFFEGLLLFIGSIYYILKNKSIIKIPGLLSAYFLVIYSIERFFLEYFREPDAPLIGFFSRGQFYSLITLFIGIVCIYYVKHRKNSCNNSVFMG